MTGNLLSGSVGIDLTTFGTTATAQPPGFQITPGFLLVALIVLLLLKG